MRRAALASSLWALAAPPAGAACRQAPVLGLDISGSVDAREYRQQLDGPAEALGRASVRGAFLSLPEAPIEFAVSG